MLQSSGTSQESDHSPHSALIQKFDTKTCQCKCEDLGARGQCLVQYNKVRRIMVRRFSVLSLQMWDPDSCECRCRPEEIKGSQLRRMT